MRYQYGSGDIMKTRKNFNINNMTTPTAFAQALMETLND
jgi:hypothetical protein